MVIKNILLVEDDADDGDFFSERINQHTKATLYGLANNGKEPLICFYISDFIPDNLYRY